MPSQRPFFLSGFFAAFRQQVPSLQTTPQANKHSTQAAASSSTSPPTTTAAAANPSATANYAHQSSAARAASGMAIPSSSSSPHTRGPTPSATNGIPIPNPSSGRRRGSDSSSEGFRDALGADKWYIGGRTAGGEERFFKMGVMRRVRSNDGLSLDRLSL